MKFSCNVSSLLEAIEPVISVAEKSISKDFPDLNKIYINAKNDSLKFSAFNGVIGIKTSLSNDVFKSLDYQFELPGEITINAKNFVNVLNSFKDRFINIELKSVDEAKEIVISLDDDKDQFQTIPCYDGGINFPSPATKFIKNITIDSSCFISSLKKLSFAIGFEKTRLEYLYLAMKISDKTARFVAGHGGRFAIIDMTGDYLLKSSPASTDILFHKETISSIINTLSSSESNEIIIRESDRKTETPQIAIDSNPYQIVLVGIDPQIKYADENKVLSLDPDIKISVRVDDIRNAANGINATISEDKKKSGGIFPTNLHIDFKTSILHIKATDVMKASRKVSILDFTNKDNVETLDINTPAIYLTEIADHAKDCDYIQLEMFNTVGKPVIVSYYACGKVMDRKNLRKEIVEKKIAEKMVMFFSTLKN